MERREHVRSCAERQLHILNSAKKALKAGGVMVYSTCTFSREENEGVIERFLAENPDFALEDAGVSFGRPTMDYARRIFPMDGGEGHFAARLRRQGECRQSSAPEIQTQADKAVLDFRAYLHGEEIDVPRGLSGYTAVAVSGMTTGFGKASNGRLKNKYPKGLRTLK